MVYPKTDSETLTLLQAETACAIMDAMVAPDDPDLGARIQRWYEDNGRAMLRGLAIDAAPYFDRIWDALDDRTTDAVVWDYEFIPAMLAVCDWDAPSGPDLPDMFTAVLTAQTIDRSRAPAA